MDWAVQFPAINMHWCNQGVIVKINSVETFTERNLKINNVCGKERLDSGGLALRKMTLRKMP